ncbi:hypothetical protein [Nannocystis punicea]|uniref:DUF4178 domain-containing protein n=1 Tax=Nannocystis punicea TaxID=2995304 RepID=A0ABY7HG69_9BACT|nr:hypothetical protein [Nannocystis poenicansa]WAS97984.1 hypothetical protein O0S08_17730 [Nannocystis poenicansa]
MLHCILCGAPFTSFIEEPTEGEHHETMVCAKHPDETLLEPGKRELWGGEDLETSPALFSGREVWIVEAWQWLGFGFYALLSDGDLLMIVCWGSSDVCVVRVPRSERALERPVGLPSCRGEPLATAIREGWTLSAVRRFGAEHVVVEFPGKGEFAFNSWMESWGSLGDGRYFIYETWLSDSDDPQVPASEMRAWPR